MLRGSRLNVLAFHGKIALLVCAVLLGTLLQHDAVVTALQSTPPPTRSATTTASTRRARPLLLAHNPRDYHASDSRQEKDQTDKHMGMSLPRRALFRTTATWTAAAAAAAVSTAVPANALFDGGIGGLGKTRPETGVIYVNPDDGAATQTSAGLVSAELVVEPSRGTTALVSFTAPWPLLSTSTGLEVRDLATSDAAFCQITDTTPALRQATTPKQAATALSQILQTSVLAPQGKFGMYGAPSSIKVKAAAATDNGSSSSSGVVDLYTLSFTTLTPGMRESDRKYYVAARTMGESLVLLLVGTTAARFSSQEPLMRKVAESWQVVAAPKTRQR